MPRKTPQAGAAGDSALISSVVGSIAARVCAELTSVTGPLRVDISRGRDGERH